MVRKTRGEGRKINFIHRSIAPAIRRQYNYHMEEDNLGFVYDERRAEQDRREEIYQVNSD